MHVRYRYAGLLIKMLGNGIIEMKEALALNLSTYLIFRVIFSSFDIGHWRMMEFPIREC